MTKHNEGSSAIENKTKIIKIKHKAATPQKRLTPIYSAPQIFLNIYFFVLLDLF